MVSLCCLGPLGCYPCRRVVVGVRRNTFARTAAGVPGACWPVQALPVALPLMRCPLRGDCAPAAGPGLASRRRRLGALLQTVPSPTVPKRSGLGAIE